MAEILIEKDLARERLEQFLATHKIKIANTIEELYAHSIKDDDGEEVDEFMRLREEWRKEDDSHREIN
ncbi:MAG: hypothetical protein H0X72_22265 [Acidobacteria bacterium]|jgi:hypothetical protein|nr:hypothetical protein [Acidobacteriota bacterium]HEV8158893.1 hypothetical protein [Pyrinomonadaceae bacterium]